MKTNKAAINTFNIPWAKPYFSGKEKEYVADAIDSTWISDGYYIEKFEHGFLRLHNTAHGLTTSSGTTALQLALLAAGIKRGDEVIVPGFTFAAPANMVLSLGAKPIFADIDVQSWCLDPVLVEKNITKKTRAIICVHLYGNVCAMDDLKSLAKKYKLVLIEDTAQAAFSRYRGQLAGTFGDFGCFSFQATKTISMGEGGFVITQAKECYDKMRLLRNHGMRQDQRYWHETVGYNFRLTNLQAALGYAQLENRAQIFDNRRRVYHNYRQQLEREKGITFQAFNRDVEPMVWSVAIKIDPAYFKGDRDFVMRSLLSFGIETRPGFYPASVMPLYGAGALPVSEEISRNVICLPSFPSLSESEIVSVCQQLKSLIK